MCVNVQCSICLKCLFYMIYTVSWITWHGFRLPWDAVCFRINHINAAFRNIALFAVTACFKVGIAMTNHGALGFTQKSLRLFNAWSATNNCTVRLCMGKHCTVQKSFKTNNEKKSGNLKKVWPIYRLRYWEYISPSWVMGVTYRHECHICSVRTPC